jgi:hypothetical protein
MARELTEDQSGNLNFTENATDVDGDQITSVRVELDQIDGVSQTGAARNPSWLNWTTTFNPAPQGTSELVFDVTLTADQLSLDTTYTFLFEVSDGIDNATLLRDLEVKESPTGLPNLGTRLWIISDDNASIYEWSLGTAFDISTLSFQTEHTNVQEGTAVDDLDFSKSGDKLIVNNGGIGEVRQWDLTTPFDISTASNLQSRGFFQSITTIHYYQNTGDAFLWVDEDTESLEGEEMDTPFDTQGTLTAFNVPENYDVQYAHLMPTGDGIIYVIGESEPQRVVRDDWNIAFPLAADSGSITATEHSIADPASLISSKGNTIEFGGIITTKDGSKLFLTDNANSYIYQFSMGTAFDLTTLSLDHEIDISGTLSFPKGLAFN